jgi:AcrR family transcriptional regulator
MSTEDTILESANRCFTRYGYRRTSMDTIAKDARVAKGTVYLYCADKADLFTRTLERELRTWIEELSSLIDDRPAPEILADMAQRDAAFVEKRPLVAELLAGLLDGDHPDLQPRFEELRRLGLRHVIEVLRLGVEQGTFAPDLDVEPTARVLQEMQLAGALLPHRGQLSARAMRRQQTAALHLVLRGLERR